MRLANIVFYIKYNTKNVDGTSIKHFSISCTKHMLFATNTWKDDFGRSELDKNRFYNSQYCVYHITGVDYNRSLSRKSIGAQIREIKEVKKIQNTSFPSVYQINEAGF